MARLALIALIALIALEVYAIFDCALAPRKRVRAMAKPLWLLLIIFLPLIGALLWFFLGRPPREAPAAQFRRGPGAPDDDAEFLRLLEQRQRRLAQNSDDEGGQRSPE